MTEHYVHADELLSTDVGAALDEARAHAHANLAERGHPCTAPNCTIMIGSVSTAERNRQAAARMRRSIRRGFLEGLRDGDLGGWAQWSRHPTSP